MSVCVWVCVCVWAEGHLRLELVLGCCGCSSWGRGYSD